MEIPTKWSGKSKMLCDRARTNSRDFTIMGFINYEKIVMNEFVGECRVAPGIIQSELHIESVPSSERVGSNNSCRALHVTLYLNKHPSLIGIRRSRGT
ncbi:hypothetical protein JTB14_038053 [Gonioctena quinquepunctata]|nr:hypothetical protein JTB14_038053 [Gonioctena quinquepunctata]